MILRRPIGVHHKDSSLLPIGRLRVIYDSTVSAKHFFIGIRLGLGTKKCPLPLDFFTVGLHHFTFLLYYLLFLKPDLLFKKLITNTSPIKFAFLSLFSILFPKEEKQIICKIKITIGIQKFVTLFY
jgi:hypothetical protein